MPSVRSAPLARLAPLLAAAALVAACGADAPSLPTEPVRLERVSLDVAIPDGDGPHPVVVHVPGGGWISHDDHEVDRAFGLTDAWEDGWAVVSVRYRVAGQGVGAADQAGDVAAALEWVEGGGDGRGLAGPVLAMGHSAGAHLLALAVAGGGAPAPEALVLVSGIYDLADDVRGSPMLQGGLRAAFGCAPACPPGAARLQPAAVVDGDEPPTTLVHGTGDEIAPLAGSQRFEQALRAAGVPVRLVAVDGAAHRDGELDEAVRDALSEVRDQLARGDTPSNR